MKTYAEAGVSIDKGDEFVSHIKKAVRSTYTKSVLGDIGSFGAFYDGRLKGYKSPVLVSSVDGVGTKLIIAQMMDRHDTIGQDLVNHCVNDILVCGAQPLFFLDYFAAGNLNPRVATQILSGFVKACRENQCSLIGGETAEMPGLYAADQYDLCGTIVGVVEKKKIIAGKRVKKGNVLIGLGSAGLHTNGYSLARSVLLGRFKLDDFIDEIGGRLGDVLLSIHRSYLKIVQGVIERFEVHGMAHITGGGIVGNTMRVVPKGLSVSVDWSAWERPPIFRLIQRVGGVPEEDMRRTFNLGAGLVLIVSARAADKVLGVLRKKGADAFFMGEVIKRQK